MDFVTILLISNGNHYLLQLALKHPNCCSCICPKIFKKLIGFIFNSSSTRICIVLLTYFTHPFFFIIMPNHFLIQYICNDMTFILAFISYFRGK